MTAGPERPTNASWDNERLRDAYLAMAAGPAPEGLIGSTLLTTSRARRSRAGWAHWRLAGAASIATFAGVALVAVVVAGLMPLAGHTRATATPELRSDGLPMAVDGLRVQTVSEALGAETAGNPADDSLLAIGGWLTFMPVGFCPNEPPLPALDESCTSQKLILTEAREELVTVGPASEVDSSPLSPYLSARMLDGSFIDEPPGATGPTAGGGNGPLPVHVVLVGHFHDHRAAQCAVDQRTACESAFVVDQMAWLDGYDQGPAIGSVTDGTTGVFNPRLGEAGVLAALRSSLDPADTVVSAAAVTPCGIASFITGELTPSGNCPGTLWFVRVAGPAPKFPPMSWGVGESGWMVLDDATGRILGAGGWGFVSAASGSFDPSPHPGPNGFYWLPTYNWLTGYGVCAGTGLDAVLHGSPTDLHVAWLDGEQVVGPLGEPEVVRLEIVWPAGYRARFDPNLEILDENGNVVMREGDTVTGDCGGGGGVDVVYWPSR
jgi:hypothetical protein